MYGLVITVSMELIKFDILNPLFKIQIRVGLRVFIVLYCHWNVIGDPFSLSSPLFHKTPGWETTFLRGDLVVSQGISVPVIKTVCHHYYL